jgi:hypothetical protein
MRLASLYGGVAMLSPGVGEAWEGPRGANTTTRRRSTLPSGPFSPRRLDFGRTYMRGALFAGVWGGSPGLYGRGKQCFLFRFCALALVGAGQDFRGALRMKKGNPPRMASGRSARDYQKCNRDVSRNLPHRGCDGS